MYQIEDTESAIKEVQRLLGINQSGIFDKATQNAVRGIKDLYKIEGTEEVDIDTFDAILKEYHKAQEKKLKDNYLHKPDFPYLPDDFDDNVRLINDALRIVLQDYAYEDILPFGKYFNNQTLNALNFLQNVFKMEISNEINEAFINRLLLEKKAIEIKNQY